MDEDGSNLLFMSELDQCLKVTLMTVNAPVSQETHEMESPFCLFASTERIQENGIREKPAIINGAVDQRQILVDDAA
jgi:hypothetical protein